MARTDRDRGRVEPSFGPDTDDTGLRVGAGDRADGTARIDPPAGAGDDEDGGMATTARARRTNARIEPRLDGPAPAREAGDGGPRRSGGGAKGGGGGSKGGGKPAGRAPRRRRGIGLFGFLGRLVYWGVVLSIWGAVGVAGVIGYTFATLPQTDEWTVPARPPNVEIVDAAGAPIANRGDTGGEAVRLEQLPPYLPEAVIAIEDRRFYHHFGIDPLGLARALVTNLTAGGVVQGGSTLTQQLAKNLFLKPDRTMERKLQEVVLALWLEWRFSKDEILEMYLNRVYLGAGAYGVDGAARAYFGKSAREVTLGEAATLAGLLKAPSRYAPSRDAKLAHDRATTVLAAMAAEGYIDRAAAKRAADEPPHVVAEHNTRSENYVADWVMDLLPGYLSSLSQDVVVKTTVDLRVQRAAEAAIRDALAGEAAKFRVSQGALVAIDNDGAVKALVGGRDYAASQFDRAVQARRQPGSAFKPFVYLTAIERGYSPDHVMTDAPVSIKGWQPKNYDGDYLGPVTLRTALAKSLNTVAAQLAAEVGPSAVANTARRLGIVSKLHENPSIALGTAEVTPLEITSAYVPFANGGFGVIPYVIDSIVTKDGKVLFRRQGGGPGRVIDPRAVGVMNSMLQGVVQYGTGAKAAIPGRPVGGKTGTSQDFRDAWFIGYVTGLTAGVWFGNDDNSPTKKATGGALTSAVWHRFMAEAVAGRPVLPLPGTDLVPPPAPTDTIAATIDGLERQGPALPGAAAPAPVEVPVTAPAGSGPTEGERTLLERLFEGSSN